MSQSIQNSTKPKVYWNGISEGIGNLINQGNINNNKLKRYSNTENICCEITNWT